MASSTGMGSWATTSATSCSGRTTTSVVRLSTKGRARPMGRGVTRFSQCDDSPGDSTGTGTISRGRSPATRA